MNQSTIRPIKWFPFLALFLLIVGCNSILYLTPYFQPIPVTVVIGSMVDFVLVMPLLTYYFVIRKRYSWKLTVLVAFLGYGFSTFLIPDVLLEQVSIIPKVLILLEAGIIAIELYLIAVVCGKIPLVKKSYNELPQELPFLLKIKQAFNVHFAESRLLEVVISDITMLYYALLSWRKPAFQSASTFTYHKNTSFVPFYFMLIHALVIESVGLHYFFSQINHTLSLILLFINAYSVLFLIGQMQAVKKVPLIADDQSLRINIGFIKKMNLPYTKIKEIKKYEGPETIPSKEKEFTFEALVSDFIPEKPSIELILKESVTINLIYGFKKKVTRVVIKVDDSMKLYNLIEERLSSIHHSGEES